MKCPLNRAAVIIGIGELTEKLADPQLGREPQELMHDAVKKAELDAGVAICESIDRLDVVMPMSWRYSDLASQLSEALGAAPAHAELGPSGGESPLRYMHRSAQAIARGEAEIAVITGGEAQHTLAALQRRGHMPDWTPFAADGPNFADSGDAVNPLSLMHGLYLPVNVYGFFEAAFSHSQGQTPDEAQSISAQLWARYAAAAKTNPYSWRQETLSADDIQTVTAKNRLIGGPYPKYMVANMNVNQSAAVIITSLETAQRLGVCADKMIFVGGGASADEPRDFLQRDQYKVCHAQNAVLNAMRGLMAGVPDALEIYSCFPCVPKMAQEILKWPLGTSPTVTGGLSFFGAPLNNYMTHAACAMVRRLRAGAPSGSGGLLYGQGEFMTKHYGLMLSPRVASAAETVLTPNTAQKAADAQRSPPPPLDAEASGPAVIETFTLMYDRSGELEKGVVMARMADGRRTLAAVEAADVDALKRLSNGDHYPIGAAGNIKTVPKLASRWHFAESPN